MSSNDTLNTLVYTCTSYCYVGSFNITNGKLLYNLINNGQLQYCNFFMFDNSTFILNATQTWNLCSTFGKSRWDNKISLKSPDETSQNFPLVSLATDYITAYIICAQTT